MKILYVVAGTGNTFYCENCTRDGVLVETLRQAGHEVWMAPLYLPLFNRPEYTIHETPVFFGGINVYLQQHAALFRHSPRWFDRGWDARWLLRLALSSLPR